MRKILLLILIYITGFIFAEEGIVLHPNLSYRNTEDLSKIVERHTFGDTLELTGEEVTAGDSKYKVFTKDGASYASYFYYLVENTIKGSITQSTYIYNNNDLSAITNERLKLLQFVAVDKDSKNSRLTKVYYLVWDSVKGSGVVKSGWVKSKSISLEKDDWKASIKYFLAKNEKDAEMRQSYLAGILKLHKGTVFISIIQDMFDNDHLRIEDEASDVDPIFAGTNNYLLNDYVGKLFEGQSVNSPVIIEGSFKIKLIAKSEGMYYVETENAQGWISGLNN